MIDDFDDTDCYYETFESLIDAVEENNDINEAEWKDWEDSFHIQDVYGKLDNDKYKDQIECFLDVIISYNGDPKVISAFKKALSLQVCGVMFS